MTATLQYHLDSEGSEEFPDLQKCKHPVSLAREIQHLIMPLTSPSKAVVTQLPAAPDVQCPLAVHWHLGLLPGFITALTSAADILKLYAPALPRAVLKS